MLCTMPRPTRLDLAGIPQHIVQRGVDRHPCFVLEIHYREYLRYLADEAERYDCRIHAYVLMCNHVHLLATPAENGGIGRLMQGLGRSYVPFFNLLMDRTGTLWEGRFKSCLVDSDAYLLRCYRYIELNPVRAGITAEPGAFRWSSYHCNGLGAPDPLICPHPTYRALGSTAAERCTAYRAIVSEGCERAEAEHIRTVTSRQRAFGATAFQHELETLHLRPMGSVKRGRPHIEREPE
jgi:putative transposase